MASVISCGRWSSIQKRAARAVQPPRRRASISLERKPGMPPVASRANASTGLNAPFAPTRGRSQPVRRGTGAAPGAARRAFRPDSGAAARPSAAGQPGARIHPHPPSPAPAAPPPAPPSRVAATPGRQRRSCHSARMSMLRACSSGLSGQNTPVTAPGGAAAGSDSLVSNHSAISGIAGLRHI